MSTFHIHTIESAPEQSKPVLRQLEQNFGLIPNIAGAMAESPVLIGGFIGIFQKVHSGTFTEAQIQTLLLTNAVTNACTWAVAFHTALALKEGLSPADVEAIRDGRAPADRKHAALVDLDENSDREARTPGRPGRERISRSRLPSGPGARGSHGAGCFDDHELRRQHHASRLSKRRSRNTSGPRRSRLAGPVSATGSMLTGAVRMTDWRRTSAMLRRHRLDHRTRSESTCGQQTDESCESRKEDAAE